MPRRRWYCMNCGRLNHARKDKCRWCRFPRWILATGQDLIDAGCAGVIVHTETTVMVHPLRPGNPIEIPSTCLEKPLRHERDNPPAEWEVLGERPS